MNSEEEGIRSGLIGIDTKVPFEIRFSLGNLITGSGLALLLYSVGAFLLNNGESSLVQTLGFVYGIPASLGGAALKYAELPPVPIDTTPQATAAREALATKVQAKIFSDATRFCYGDAHSGVSSPGDAHQSCFSIQRAVALHDFNSPWPHSDKLSMCSRSSAQVMTPGVESGATKSGQVHLGKAPTSLHMSTQTPASLF